jgi:mannosylfructose-phosphate synthase
MKFEVPASRVRHAPVPPRIAMVSTHGYVAATPPLGAADTGGQVVYVLQLSRKLAQLGYEVDIWTRRFGDQPEEERCAEGVRILRVGCGGPDFIPKEYLHRHIDEWCAGAAERIQREHLRYTFLNSHYWDGALAGQGLCRRFALRHLHTPHSLGVWKERQMRTDYPGDAAKFELVYNFSERIRAEREAYAEASGVVATSPDQLALLRDDYAVDDGKLCLVPPGYDDTRFYPVGAATREALRRRLGFDGKVVLSLGRLARNKGYDLLIRAFSEVAAREPSARLVLAVGGEHLDAAESQILEACRALVDELGLRSRVTFMGFVADAELADFYRAADVFVLCSRYEPFGMTAIEAMACGTPTVVTTHGGLFRTLRFGVDGLFADTFDAMDLGITILKPLRHRQLAERLSRNGAETARSLFTWTGVAQQLIGATERAECRPGPSGERAAASVRSPSRAPAS